MVKKIRDHIDSDIDNIIKIYTLEYKAMPEEIETLKSAPKILVYDDQSGVEGFIHLSTNGNHCYIEMGVISNEKIMSIGSTLWKEVLVLSLSIGLPGTKISRKQNSSHSI